MTQDAGADGGSARHSARPAGRTAQVAAALLRAVRRCVSSLPALLGVVVFTFILMRVLPGDPAVFFASGPNAGPEEIEMIRKQMGLDRPMPEQLIRYLGEIGRAHV